MRSAYHWLLATTLVLPTLLPAQQPQVLPASTTGSCGFDDLHQQLRTTDAIYQQRMQRFEAAARLQGGSFERSLSTYKIPVVVHVMETGTALTAITDDQIRAGIRALNERFRKVAGTAGAGGGVDVGIEFVLAVRDPGGNCTNGITRRNMTGNATYMASGVFRQSAGISDAELKALDAWDQTRYYNIWAVSEIDNNNGGNGIQGYAVFAGAHGLSVDGCVLLANELVDPSSTTLTHELGHALNVYHTFEGDNDGTSCPLNGTCGTQGDEVCDTPPHIRSNSDCNSGGTNGCNSNSSNSLFVFNYMDYSSCGNQYTSGQAARMVLALTTDRASFLAANGNNALVPVATPVMDILPSASLLCGTGQSVTLYDNSTCIPNTWIGDSEFPDITYTWSISNGVNTYTSTAANPTFTLASTGVYNATVTVTTLLGSTTHTENGVVLVTSAPVAACVPTSSNPSANYGLTVSRVRFNTFESLTSDGVNGVYQNFSCAKNTVVQRNGTYPLNITVNGGTNGTENFEAYIDYNNNGSFLDAGELVASGSSPSVGGQFNGTVTIPVTAVQNTLLRMRVIGDLGISASDRNCSAPLLVGDVEDYGVYVSSALAAVSIAATPGTTITYGTSVTFTPTATNGGASPTYQWFKNGAQVGTGNTYVNSTLLPGDQVYCRMFSNLAGVLTSPATSNTLSMTVTGPPQSDFTAASRAVCVGGSIAFSDRSLLAPTSWSWSFPGGTPSSSTAQNPTVTYSTAGTYAVTLVASNGLGTGTTMTKTAYITVYSTPLSGCTVTRSTTPAGEIGILGVQLNTINQVTAFNDAVMGNFLCSHITNLDANTTYGITVNVSPFNTQWLRVYIDYNRDGDFVDAGEQIFSPANGTGARTGTFTTPVAPQSGLLMRMRVISDFTNTTPGPCTTPLQYGQVEEYGIVFNAVPNTAPLLNAASSPVMTTVLEDAVAPVGAVGTLVSDLVDLIVPAGGRDNVTDGDAGAVTGMAVIGANTANGTWSYTLNNGGTWSPLGTPSNITARLLPADANTRLYFQPAANFNGSITDGITFRAWDRTSGTSGGTADASVNGGSTAFSSVSDVVLQAVTAVNDAPVLNNAASPALAAVNEDAAVPVGAVGTSITTLIDLNVPAGGLDNSSDVDATPVTGVAVFAADASNGTWSYSVNNGVNWTALGTPAAGAARLLAADASTRLYFRPNANFNGTVASAITFRAWDRTAGTNGATADVSVNGGSTPYSAATDVASLVVNAVNDAPVLTVPGAQSMQSNGTLVFSTGAGNAVLVADLDAGPGDVQVVMGVSGGTLTLSTVSGLNFLSGDGTADAAMEFKGVLAAVSAALNGMSYQPAPGNSGTDVLSINVDDMGNTGSGGVLSDAGSVTITVEAAAVQVSVRAFLEGPYSTVTGQMSDALRSLPGFPTAQPYSAAPWNHVGTETVAPAVLAVTGNNAVVDWVLVELRDAGDNTTVVARAAGLLQRDGDVVATNGTAPLTLDIGPGNYHVAVLHRNHMGVMTAAAIALSGTSTVVDLTLGTTATHGTEARKTVGTVQALWTGDVLADGELRYTGANNDRDPMLFAIGGSVPTNTITGYLVEDINLDGVVKYSGVGNDRDMILQNVGGTVPTNVRYGQLP
ncbi:MAG: PKD domain-containing protein [Flavobacteriales bacterium]|jgi:PKD repeat protein|nr:PKD domain-containing protein [Flavobacteriales bacterium]